MKTDSKFGSFFPLHPLKKPMELLEAPLLIRNTEFGSKFMGWQKWQQANASAAVVFFTYNLLNYVFH